ncbi:MAG: DUF3473 domain-containing protein [Pirellulales bacterium]|nr:DUF3473 domain-containing protein [Pirellulales bacterium]
MDVEDYFQVSGFERNVRREDWDDYASRVVGNTGRLLDLLDRHEVKGTFFVLGWVGRRHPELVRRIHGRGHEIASHGFWHRLVYDQSPEEFRRDVVESRDVLADAIGERIDVYRAPSFSITKRSLWALDVLVEEGFRVDSSVFPVLHDRYGIPGAQRGIHRVATSAGAIWEFPMPTVRLAGRSVPVGGGGYFRLYPIGWSLRWLARVNRERPFVFYVHPWEIDPDQPRIPTRGLLSRARHYVNLASTERKLGVLLARFRFGRIRDVIGRIEEEDARPRSRAAASDDVAV